MLEIVLIRGSVAPRSRFLMATCDTPDACARSACDQPTSARAARIWARLITRTHLARRRQRIHFEKLLVNLRLKYRSSRNILLRHLSALFSVVYQDWIGDLRYGEGMVNAPEPQSWGPQAFSVELGGGPCAAKCTSSQPGRCSRRSQKDYGATGTFCWPSCLDGKASG